MNTINVNVCLYGSIAKFGGGKHVAQLDLTLPEGASKSDVLQHFGISEAERGYLFINAVLYDVPGLITGKGRPLANGDHIGIFSTDRLWPYQYRDGVRMSPELAAAMQEHGALHHSYQFSTGDG